MVPSVFDVLDEIAVSVAEPIRELFSIIEVPHYANLLSTFSWFTDGTDARYGVEANRRTNPLALRQAFRSHGVSESGHHVFAIRDLEALGFLRTPEPPDEVMRLHGYLNECDAAPKLGCSGAIESMASLLSDDAFAMKQRLELNNDQFSFFALHIEADTGAEGHGAQLRSMVEEHLSTGQWLPFMEGAIQGGRMWGEMVTAALRTPLYASRTAS